jgi:hypothetical protein
MVSDDEIRLTVEKAIPYTVGCDIKKGQEKIRRFWLFKKIKEYIEDSVQSSQNNDSLGMAESTNG